MNYCGYDTSVVERYRVKLVGWTYQDFVNPSKIGTINDIRKLRDALRSGECFWTRLNQDEVKTYLQNRKENGEGIQRTRRQRSDKGKARKRRIESDDEDIENSPPSKKTRRAQKGREGPSASALPLKERNVESSSEYSSTTSDSDA